MKDAVCLFLLVSATAVVPSAALEISVPSVVTGEEGLPLNIPCNFTLPPRTDGRRLVGTWRKEGLIVVHFSMGQSVPGARYDGRLGRWRDFSSGQCSLVIRAARMEDSGEYTIAVQAARTEESEEYTGAEDGPEPRRTRIASVAVRVTARPGPVIPGSIQHAWQKPKLSLTPESVREGEALTLTCAVESHPRGKLSLHKLGEPRPLKEGFAAQLTLTLPNVSREDSGEYSCVFQHGKNTGTSTIQVSVIKKFNKRNLGIIVGVSLSIAIIFLLCCIYMVHKRLKGKKQKQEREVNDPYTTLDHKTMSPDYDIIRRTTANS